MIHDPEELAVGQVVFLFPHTHTASWNVKRGLTVKVMKDPKRHWPMIMVEWEENGIQRWELVHRDNIKKRDPAKTRTKAEKHDGDSVVQGSAGMGRWASVRKMPGRAQEIELSEDEEQGTLF